MKAQWDDSAIDVMRARIMSLAATDEAMEDAPMADSTNVVTSVGGWKLLDSSNWVPSAIGVYAL